jgi:hypothetical protein
MLNVIASSGANLITLYTDFHNKLVFLPVKPFQPSLMFVGKAGGLP